MLNILRYILLFLVFIHSVNSQERNFCGTEIPSQQWENIFSSLINDFKKAHEQNSSQQFTEYTIPVIFHVIHSGQSVGTFPNIVQAQIISQITVLNQDYAGTGFNYNTYP